MSQQNTFYIVASIRHLIMAYPIWWHAPHPARRELAPPMELLAGILATSVGVAKRCLRLLRCPIAITRTSVTTCAVMAVFIDSPGEPIDNGRNIEPAPLVRKAAPRACPLHAEVIDRSTWTSDSLRLYPNSRSIAACIDRNKQDLALVACIKICSAA